MKWLISGARRLVPASVCAMGFASVGALYTAAVSRMLQGRPIWLEPYDVVFIALPAFVGGAVFFPAGQAILGSRSRFVVRAVLATTVGAVVHRLLLLTAESSPPSGARTLVDSLFRALSWSVDTLANFALHPRLSLLLPSPGWNRYWGIESALLTELLAIAMAGGVALTVYPALRRELRRRLGLVTLPKRLIVLGRQSETEREQSPRRD